MKLQRAKKQIENGRCCWICGKVGGAGFTTALRHLGYDVPRDQMAYAHPPCFMRLQRKLKEERDAT